MRWLAVDTSSGSAVGVIETAYAGAGLDAATAEPVLVAGRSNDDPRGHVEAIAPMLRECLAQAGGAVDAVVVGTGPAPFTGLRVGIASGVAFARAAGLPVHGVCSLDAIAWGRTAPTLVVSDARRREVYWAAYDGSGDVATWSVQPPQVGPATDVVAHLQRHPASVVGPATGLYPGLEGESARPDPAALVAVAAASLAAGLPLPLEPRYLRRPDIHAAAAPKRAS